MRQKAKEEIKKCKYCGKTFKANATKSYCCKEHRTLYWNGYRKEYFNNTYYPQNREKIISRVINNRKKESC